MKFTFLKAFFLWTTLSISNLVNAGIIFQSDFSDPSANDFNYIGTGWSVSGGKLLGSGSGGFGFALIDGITTPNSFTLEADVQINQPGDFGHAGLAWGVTDGNNFSTSYFRSHSDQITSWSRPGGGESLAFPGINLLNQVSYRMTVDIDYLSREYTVSLDGFSKTISGTNFDQYITQQGGGVGFIKWNQNVTYDNVILSTATVPEPSTLAIFALGMIGLASRRFKKQS